MRDLIKRVNLGHWNNIIREMNFSLFCEINIWKIFKNIFNQIHFFPQRIIRLTKVILYIFCILWRNTFYCKPIQNNYKNIDMVLIIEDC